MTAPRLVAIPMVIPIAALAALGSMFTSPARASDTTQCATTGVADGPLARPGP